MKGSTANPGGKPKGLASRVREATSDGETLVTFFQGILGGTIKCNARDRIEAAKWLADRGWGRAVETSVQVEADQATARAAVALTDDQLESLARTIAPPSQPGTSTPTINLPDLASEAAEQAALVAVDGAGSVRKVA
jgi:hypothetical protein